MTRTTMPLKYSETPLEGGERVSGSKVSALTQLERTPQPSQAISRFHFTQKCTGEPSGARFRVRLGATAIAPIDRLHRARGGLCRRVLRPTKPGDSGSSFAARRKESVE